MIWSAGYLDLDPDLNFNVPANVLLISDIYRRLGRERIDS